MKMSETLKQEIAKVGNKNETSKSVLTVAACRQRGRSETNLQRLKTEMMREGFKVIPEEFLETFRDLAKIGVGSLEIHPGEPPKWKWHFNMQEVGAAAFNTPPVLPKAAPKAPLVIAPPERRTVLAVLPGINRQAKIEIPVDVTVSELNSLVTLVIAELKQRT